MTFKKLVFVSGVALVGMSTQHGCAMKRALPFGDSNDSSKRLKELKDEIRPLLKPFQSS